MNDNSIKSKNVHNYLNSESRLHYTMTTTKYGHRTTVPYITSQNKILIAGDSVAMGLGVSDSQTFSSQLQSALNKQAQVINGGVNSYKTKDILHDLSLIKNDEYSHLIYILCENDIKSFSDTNGIIEVANKINQIRYKFKTLTLIHHSHMNIILSDFFNPTHTEDIERLMKKQRKKLVTVMKDLNINYLNWYEIAQAYTIKQGSIFARFSLYSDNTHFSPTGNKLLSNEFMASFSEVILND